MSLYNGIYKEHKSTILEQLIFGLTLGSKYVKLAENDVGFHFIEFFNVIFLFPRAWKRLKNIIET